MWTPTHVQLIVHRARNLKVKGKSGTNDCYVTIQLGKEKYHTSIQEKSVNPEWNEECDFPLPERKQSFKLSLYHRNFIGIDDFLGQTEISLDQFNAYERPRKRWFPLFCKTTSKKQDRSRGEIELTSIFVVQNMSGSVCNMNRNKTSAKALSFKNLTNNIGSKLILKWPSKTSLSGKSDLSSGNFSAQSTSQKSLDVCRQGDVSPNAIELFPVSLSLASLAEEDSAVDSKGTSIESCINVASQEITNRSSGTCSSSSAVLPVSSKTVKENGGPTDIANSLQQKPANIGNFKDKIRKIKDAAPPSVKSKTMSRPLQMALYELHEMEEYRKNVQKNLQENESLFVTLDLIDTFKDFSQEGLIHLIVEQKQQLSQKDDYIRDLEDYIDNLLVKVIETQPKLLQKSCGNSESPTKESSPLSNIMHYSTIPRNYSHANPSTKRFTTSSHCNRKKYVQSIWSRGPVATSPFKKLQAFIKYST